MSFFKNTNQVKLASNENETKENTCTSPEKVWDA